MKPIHLICCTLLLSFAASLTAQDLGGVPLPQRGGLAVIQGEAGLEHARTLAASGQWLVRLVSNDPAERARMLEAAEDLIPLVSVGPLNGEALPFGPDSVNLVLLKNGSQITREEVSRVLAPKGLFLGSSGEFVGR